MRASASRNRGMILVVVMVAIVVIAALGAGYLLSARSQATRTQVSEESVQLLTIAEAGVAAAVQELQTGGDGDLDSIPFGGDGGRYSTTTTSVSDLYTVTSTATHGPWSRTVEVVLELVSETTQVNVRAAIQANTNVTTGGNFVVDGRDYDYSTGTMTGDPGVYGISTSGTITRQGSSQIGGNGAAPAQSTAQTEQNVDWGPDGYLSSPDSKLGIPEGTLKAAAIARGTYFTSGAQFDAWLAANGGGDPGGSIVYVECDSWISVDLGITIPNASPSVLVCHNASGNMLWKNIHGNWKGLIMPDCVDHENGTSMIYGAILCNSGQLGNAFGNGNATMRYSSNALGNLPTVVDGGYTKRSWREVP